MVLVPVPEKFGPEKSTVAGKIWSRKKVPVSVPENSRELPLFAWYRFRYQKNWSRKKVTVQEKFGPGKSTSTVTLCHVTMLLVTITMLNLKLSQTLPPGLDPLHVHGSLALEVLEHPAH